MTCYSMCIIAYIMIPMLGFNSLFCHSTPIWSDALTVQTIYLSHLVLYFVLLCSLELFCGMNLPFNDVWYDGAIYYNWMMNFTYSIVLLSCHLIDNLRFPFSLVAQGLCSLHMTHAIASNVRTVIVLAVMGPGLRDRCVRVPMLCIWT